MMMKPATIGISHISEKRRLRLVTASGIGRSLKGKEGLLF
jgi:hypothetical protein